jgi:hypothetical protein
MIAAKNFIVRMENPEGFSGGFIFSPINNTEFVYVLAARHSLVNEQEIAWRADELSLDFLVEKIWCKYQLQVDDTIVYGKNNESEDIGILIIKKSSLPVNLDFSKCPALSKFPQQGAKIEITGIPKVVNNELKRTLYQLTSLSDKDYYSQMQIEVSDPLIGEYNADNLVEGYSGSPIIVTVKKSSFICGLFLAYENRTKRILGIDLSLINDLLISIELKPLLLQEIETDEVILDAIENLNKNSQRVLSRVRNSIGSLCLPRTIIEENAKNLITSCELAIFTGKPGSGKSALVKHIFESLQDDYETLAFQGEQLDRKNIEQIFSEHPFDFTITLDKVLDSPAFNKKKILLIDSIEKVLETSNADTILDFFELLSKRQDITLVLTCRSYAIEQLKIRFLRHFPPFPHFEVPMLTDPELILVAETYPVIKPFLTNISLSKVLQIPFNLDKAISLPENSLNEGIDSETKFKQIMWEYVIEGLDKETDANKRIIRGEVFMKIALQRASTMSAYTNVPDAQPAILHALISDNIIDPEPIFKKSFAAAHDIYEDWALTRHIESNHLKYITEEGNYIIFYESLGSSPAIRRAYRIWISEKIQTISHSVNGFIKSTLKEHKIQKYWKDEMLIAIMQSPYSDAFLLENRDFLFTNNFEYFKRINFLVQVACQEPDFTLLNHVKPENRIQLYHNINLVPFGEGWINLINFIYSNLDMLESQMRLILSMMLQWQKVLKTNQPLPAEAGNVGRILVWYYKLFTSTKVLPESRKSNGEKLHNGIVLVFRLSKLVKEDLKLIIENAFHYKKNTDDDYAIRNLYDKIIDLVLDGHENKNICFLFPELVMEIAEKKWFYYPPTREEIDELNKISPFGAHYRSGIHSENNFGLKENIARDYFPASPYQTPILNLLYVSPYKTIKFIIKLLNHAADSYIQSDYGMNNEFLFPADTRSEVSINMLNGKQITHYASPTLWNMFRGTYIAAPYLLESVLMALESYMLSVAETLSEVKDDKYLEHLERLWDYCYDALISESNNVMASAVLLSVSSAYKNIVGRRIFPLLKVKEIYQWDLYRHINERKARSMIGLEKNAIIHQRLLYNFQKLEHRNKNIQDLVIDLSLISKYTEEIFAIIDVFNSQNPTDNNWRMMLSRMDRRKFKFVAEIENGIVVETELDEDLKQIVEENKKVQAETNVVSNASLWCIKKFNNETVDNDNYETWSKFYSVSISSISNKSIHKLHKNTALIAAIGIRDFFISLSDSEKRWCINTIIEVFNYEIFERNKQADLLHSTFTAFETDGVFSVIPIVMSHSDISLKNLLKQHIFFALITIEEKSERDCLIESINKNLWQSESIYVLRCIDSLIKYSEISHLRRRIAYYQQEYEIPRKNRLFLFFKTVWGKIQLKILRKQSVIDQTRSDNKYNEISNIYSTILDQIMEEIIQDTAPSNFENLDFETSRTDYLFEALKIIPANTHYEILRDYYVTLLHMILENVNNNFESYNDKIHYSLQQLFQQKFALFLLTQPGDIALNHFKKLIDWCYTPELKGRFSNKRYEFAEKCLDEIIQQLIDDESKSSQFWLLWDYLLQKSLENKNFIFDSKLLLNYQFIPTSKYDWIPLKGKKYFFETLILEGGDLYSAVKLIAGIGFNELMPDGIIWLAERISNEWPDKEYWTFYVEKIVIQTYYDSARRKEIMETAKFRNAFISVLDKLLDNSASSTAYIIRDDFISSKGIVEI